MELAFGYPMRGSISAGGGSYGIGSDELECGTRVQYSKLAGGMPVGRLPAMLDISLNIVEAFVCRVSYCILSTERLDTRVLIFVLRAGHVTTWGMVEKSAKPGRFSVEMQNEKLPPD